MAEVAKKTLYLIDDEPAILKMEAMILGKSKKYDIREFTTVDAAFAHMGQDLSHDLPDVIVTDRNTKSSFNGDNLTQAVIEKNKILRSEQKNGIALVMVTGDGTEATVNFAKILKGDKLMSPRNAPMRLIQKPPPKGVSIFQLLPTMVEKALENVQVGHSR